MSTVFTKIIRGDLPGEIVWRDELCAAFLSINPLSAGHSLVVPEAEVDHWLDLDEGTNKHLCVVSRKIGSAIQNVFKPARVALMIAGFEVPHVHLHVVGVNSIDDMNWANAAASVPARELAENAERLRSAIKGA